MRWALGKLSHVGQITIEKIEILTCCCEMLCRIQYRSNPGNMHCIMQMIRLAPCNMGEILLIENTSAPKHVDHELGTDHTDCLSEVRKVLAVGSE